MKSSDKQLEANPAFVAGRAMERWWERTTPALDAFHMGEGSDRSATTLFSLIYVLAATNGWIDKVGIKTGSGNTQKSSNIIAFSRSSGFGKKV